MKQSAPIKQFAYLGGDVFIDKLAYLSRLAEKEDWYYDSPKAKSIKEKTYGVLFQYIYHTFSRAQEENKIIENEQNAIMNTGLLTPNGEEIFALFELHRLFGTPSYVGAKWYFDGFFQESSHRIPSVLRSNLPKHVDYFSDCPENMYFDTSLRIMINLNHIVDENFDRLPDAMKSYSKEIVLAILNGAESLLRKKIARNHRLVVPQYYNKKIMYLAPLQIADDIIPLAIERNEDTYRVNTIFTKGMAYCNARLLMKPESNWLVNR